MDEDSETRDQSKRPWLCLSLGSCKITGKRLWLEPQINVTPNVTNLTLQTPTQENTHCGDPQHRRFL